MNSNKKNRILMIGGSKSKFGGVAISIQNYLMNIDLDKFQVDLLSPDTDAFTFVRQNFSNKIHTYNLQQERDSFVGKIRYMIKLSKFVNRKKYSIVFIHSGQISFQWINLLVLKLCGVKNRISFSHSTGVYGNFLKRKLQNVLKRMISKWSTDRVGVTEEACEWLFDSSIIQNNCYKIFPNNIKVSKFKFSINKRKSLRKLLGFDDEDFVIGSVGRFSHEKNQVFLLEVMKKITKSSDNFKLLLIGDGPQKDYLFEKIKLYKLVDNVKILPSTEKVNEYYNVFDLFLFPSKFEGFGITILEAFSNGLPIISSNKVPITISEKDSLKYLRLDSSLWTKEVNGCQKHSFNDINRSNNSANNSKTISDLGLNIEKKTISLLDFVNIK